MTLFGQFTAASSQFLNKRGIYLGRRSTKIHVALYRWSRGKVGGHLPGCPEARIVLVDHTGAKSGVRRTSPLMYHATGAVIASKAGQPTHPAWFHSLKANPDTTIQIDSVIRTVRARVATDNERARLWPQFVASYPGYEFFRRNAKGRTIPIVILDPREDSSAISAVVPNSRIPSAKRVSGRACWLRSEQRLLARPRAAPKDPDATT